MISTASDVDFDQQLQALRTATEGLKLVTPLALTELCVGPRL